MDTPVLANHQRLTCISSVQTPDAVKGTSQKRWTTKMGLMERQRERESQGTPCYQHDLMMMMMMIYPGRRTQRFPGKINSSSFPLKKKAVYLLFAICVLHHAKLPPDFVFVFMKADAIDITRSLIGLVEFYGISTFVGFLMPNLFSYKETVLFSLA